jgi:hypothetical protein
MKKCLTLLLVVILLFFLAAGLSDEFGAEAQGETDNSKISSLLALQVATKLFTSQRNPMDAGQENIPHIME